MSTNRNIRGLVAVIAVVALIGTSCVSKHVESSNLLSDASAMEAFVDGIVTNRMQEGHVPGAVVTIVKGDRVIFNKGYGFAYLEQRIPVDPDKTLFRIASVSKVFNAMTIMRLVDEGALDVNEDVRPRLSAAGFELDNEEYGPVTLKALLTHSAGIRDASIPGVTSNPDPQKILPLRPYLEKCLPLRWQPPDETALYTDHGIALAGYVVEIASKATFQEAVEQRVLRPLAMNRTWYTVPEEQRTNLAVAYNYRDSNYQPHFFRYVSHSPAAGVFTTSSDMARLMISHLSGCKGFLKPRTVRLMHEPQYADDARLGAQWTCGFFYAEHPPSSEPYLFHIGGLYGFHSVVGLSLSRGLGVFVAQNGSGPRVFQLPDLLDALSKDAKTKAEEKTEPATTRASTVTKIKSLVGTYVLNRTISYGFKTDKQDLVHVRYAEDIKGIEVEYWQTRDNPMRFTEVAPMLFRSTKDDQQVSFRTSKDGKRVYLIDYTMRGDGAFIKIQ
jgi:CubicO group peptidase (beta-lactamase class C family)